MSMSKIIVALVLMPSIPPDIEEVIYYILLSEEEEEDSEDVGVNDG